MRNLMNDRARRVAGTIALGLALAATPAAAEWTPILDLPATTMFSVWANGDTIAVGGSSVAYLSTNAGASWRTTTSPAAQVTAIEALRMRNGRLFAATFGQGVHFSDDLGATWHPFNEGLVGGLFDSQLDVTDLQFRGDVLYAATAGAGVYARSLAGPGTWQPFGAVFEPNQAANVTALAVGGARLLASAGSNGMVFRRDTGEPEWTESDLDNVGVHAGLQAGRAEWTGTGWVVGSVFGVFRSVAGQEPWSLFSPGLGPVSWIAFATQAGRLFAAFDIPSAAVMEESDDDGATWTETEVLGGVFVYQMAISGQGLFAARGDGLWRLPLATLTAVPPAAPRSLHFALVGAQPFHASARLRFELPEASAVSIEVFDVLGRSTGPRIEQSWPAGPNEVSWDASRLAPGVYTARLSAGGHQEAVRLVHVR